MKKLFVIFVAIAMVGAFAATTMAADWSFYGSVRMATFYEGYSEDASGTGESESTLPWSQQSNSRFGARADAGAIQGVYESGFIGETGKDFGTNDDNVWARLLYARWSYSDAGYLLLGQAYTPVAYWVGSQVYGEDTGLIGYGAPYGDRRAQIKWVMAGFQLAAIDNQKNGEYDTIIPKLELRYDLALGDHSLGFFGGYQTYDDADESVDSYMGGIGYTGAFGPVWANAAVHGGVNMSNAGWANGGAAIAGGGEDTTALAAAFAVGMATSETMGFQVGLGYVSAENDDQGDEADTAMAGYVQMNWTVAPGFTIYPEIGYIDQMKDYTDADEGNIIYAGAKWQMNF